MWRPPTITMRDQLKLWPLMVELGVGSARQVDGLARQQRAGGHAGPDVGAQGTRQAHRTVDVEHAGTLVHQAGPGQRLGAVLQDGLDQRRRQPRIGLQHQRHRTADHRRRHRGAAELHSASGCRPVRSARSAGPGCVVASRFHWPRLEVDAALTSALPGATRSGLIRLSTARWPLAMTRAPRVGPRELKLLTTSSPRTGRVLHVRRADGEHRRVMPRRADGAQGGLAGGCP